MRHHADHQIGALGFLGVHHPPGQAHFHRLGLADRAGQPLRAAHARRDAKLDLGLAEFGLVAGDDEIGHHRQLAAAAQREAVDRGDPGLAGLLHDLAGPGGEEIVEIEIRRLLLAHLLDVGARGEGLVARSGQYRAQLSLVGLIGREGRDQVLKHLRIQGVERLRAVERDQRDLVMLFDGDGPVGHVLLRHPSESWGLCQWGPSRRTAIPDFAEMTIRPAVPIPRPRAAARRCCRSAPRSRPRASPDSRPGRRSCRRSQRGRPRRNRGE